MIPLKDQQAIQQRFARDLTSRVRIDFFSQKPSPIFIAGRSECVTCEETRKLLQELAALSLRIALTAHDIDDERSAAQQLGVDRVPAAVIRGQTNRPLRFFGLPSGTTFLAFVEAVIAACSTEAPVQTASLKSLRRLREEIDLKVLVTPACRYSPVMTLTAARLALSTPRIRFSAIELGEFPADIDRYRVPVTPLVVLNERFAIPGVMDEAVLVQNILLAAEGKQPSEGGDPAKTTALPREQPREQAPRTSPGGLFIPR